MVEPTRSEAAAAGSPDWTSCSPGVGDRPRVRPLVPARCNGEHPYLNSKPMIGESVIDPRTFRPDLSPELSEFLVKACAPYRDGVEQLLDDDDVVEDVEDDEGRRKRVRLPERWKRPLHVVEVADDEQGLIVYVTIYEPELNHWLPGFRKRRR